MNLFTLTKQKDDEQLLVDMFVAYKDARKNKRNKKASLEFEFNFESKIIALYKTIINRTYKPLQSTAFISTKPVIREVFAASFQDRVIHHLIYNHINPIFDSGFINDSYSCRVGKGTLYGVNRVFDFIKENSCDYLLDTYILKLDIKGYFYSIDKKILYKIIKDTLLKNKDNLKIDFETIDYLIHTTIFSDPTSNVKVFKDDKNWKILPKDKSLFYAKKGYGLPIGNLTSQLFSNIYMDIFDKYVTKELGIKYYGRYVDDSIYIHNDKRYLLSILAQIKLFLKQKLNLKLHPKKIYIQHFSKGVQFLGSYIKPNVKFIANRTKGNFYNLVTNINKEFQSCKNDIEYLKMLRTQINSYLGIMIHFSTYKLRIKILSKLENNFFDIFFVDENISKISIRLNELSAIRCI
jgi:RNA-directed DNA polymerase